MIGRPLKFNTVEELKNIENGEVQFTPGSKIRTADFKKEKDLEGYVVKNIKLFCEETLEDKLISFEINKPIKKQRRLSPRGRRMDLFVSGEKYDYIIELKNPKNLMENRQGIGQLLDYGREYADSKKEIKLFLITTAFDINTAKTIKHYKLPIRYIYFDKQRILEYKTDGKKLD